MCSTLVPAQQLTMPRVFTFYTCVFLGILRLQAKLVDLPKRCCSSGSKWGLDGKDCNTYTSPVQGVPNTDQKLCKDIFNYCCQREYKLHQCHQGVLFAKSNRHCTFSNATGSPSGIDAESCCSACFLAVSLVSAELECEIPVTQDASYGIVFQNCCNYPTDSEPSSDYDTYDEYPSKNLCEVMPGKLCTDICVPTVNSYICKCREGYVLMEDQKTCQPEKSKTKPTLATPALIPNPERPVPLRKPLLFALDRSKCSDGNPCEHDCLHTKSGQTCKCRPGYELHPDGMRCNDINECLDNVHVCDPTLEICLNEIGNYRCEPRDPSTFTHLKSALSRSTTQRTTSRASKTTEFNSTLAIYNTTPPAIAACSHGFERVGGTCVDVDECDITTNSEVCEPNEVCVNVIGSYDCRCEGGYYKETSNGPCIDRNECQQNRHSCLPEQRCDNTVGSFICHRVTSCGTGYTLNANTGQCEDDDECLLKTDNCRFLGSNYQCKNTLGSFRCERKRCLPSDSNCSSIQYCQPGYQENAYGQCIDIDECKDNKHNCDLNSQTCINRRGSFHCATFKSCNKGYRSSAFGCTDIDECATGEHNCDSNSKCINHSGGFSCTCLPGFYSVGPSQCADFDECSRLSVCPPRSSDCENVPGSYRCICKPGFRQIDQKTCSDDDECQIPGICQHFCQNVYGSFRCSCRDGYHLNENNRSCDDVDECERFKDQHLCIGECLNVPGSFACSCPSGYNLGSDGRTCQDIDECTKNPCRGDDEVCLNTRGGFACNDITCPPGYRKDHDQKNRCIRQPCRNNNPECYQNPTTYSYNFITFVSDLPIPPMGYLDLFTMRGPLTPGLISHFELQLLEVSAAANVSPVDRDYFQLRNSAPWTHQAVVALTRSVPGPQKIELQLTASISHNDNFSYKAVAKLSIHVSQYEY